MSGHLTYFNNAAVAGTAFILVQNSVLTLTENSHIYFSNNHAMNSGGVFYIASNVYFDKLQSKSTCFFNTKGSRSQARFTFVKNSAGKGGDILYGGAVALGLDGDWNCFKNISNISQNGLSLISSDVSQVCLCNETEHVSCTCVSCLVKQDKRGSILLH